METDISYECASSQCCESRECLQENRILRNALKENSLKLNLFIEHTTDLIMLLDSTFRIVHVNKAFAEKYGEIKPTSILDIFAPESRSSVLTFLQSKFMTSNLGPLQNKLLLPNPIHQSYSMPEQPHSDPDCRRRAHRRSDDHSADCEWIDAVLVTATNEKINVEMKVGQSSLEKEDNLNDCSMVILRDADIKAQAQAASQAAFEADLANRAKGLFLAKMSHEIRTPVHGILGMAQLLNEEGLTGEQREYSELILKSSEALLKVINDILDFSKIEEGKMEIESVPLDIHEVVSSAVELCKSRATNKGLELFVYISPSFPQLKGDPGRLRQVLLNLLWNAIKFSSSGHIVISANVAFITATHVKALFEIQDQGCGIAPGDFRKIFSLYHQVSDSEVRRKESGTGLGLAISKQIVQLMGGRIWATSVPKKGSVFSFDCLLGKPNEERSSTPTIEFPLKESKKVGCILIHPDTEGMSRTYGRHLRSWDIPYAVARSPDIASVKKAYRNIYSVSIQDLVMISPLSILKIVRGTMTLPSFKQVVMQEVIGKSDKKNRVFIVALALREERNRARILGADAVIGKPAYRRELYHTIDRLTESEESKNSRSVEKKSEIKTTESSERLLPATLRILVAEDNPTNMTVCLRMLQKMGLQCDTACNGKEAVDKVMEKEYDVVLMDCNMPVMDGYEAAASIRALQRTTSNNNGKSKRQMQRASITPIIAVTASAMRGDREKCLAVGMNDYISKPYKYEQLYAALKSIAPLALRLAASGGRDQVGVKKEKFLEDTGDDDRPRELPEAAMQMLKEKEEKKQKKEETKEKNKEKIQRVGRGSLHEFPSSRSYILDHLLIKTQEDLTEEQEKQICVSRSEVLTQARGRQETHRRIYLDRSQSTLDSAKEMEPSGSKEIPMDDNAFGRCLSRSPSPSASELSGSTSAGEKERDSSKVKGNLSTKDPGVKKLKKEDKAARITRVPQWGVLNELGAQRSQRLHVLNMAEMLAKLHEDEKEAEEE